jgi:sec-independent protein translocase protein TatC
MTEAIGSLWGHIAELVKRMKIVVVVFIVSTFVMLVIPGNSDLLGVTNNYQPFVSVFLRNIREMLLPDGIKLIALDISDPITLYVMAALVFSIAITLPFFTYELYKFIDPALKINEKKLISPFSVSVFLLFVFGAVFGFFFLFPTFIQSLIPFFTAVGAEMIFSIMDFYSMLFFTVIVSGFLFTIPAFFVLLVKFNVLKTRMFSKKRKYIYLGMVALAMLISPGATPQGDLYLFVALMILFEVSLLVAKRFERPSSTAVVVNPIFSTPVCKFCKAPLDFYGYQKFCKSCNKAIK